MAKVSTAVGEALAAAHPEHSHHAAFAVEGEYVDAPDDTGTTRRHRQYHMPDGQVVTLTAFAAHLATKYPHHAHHAHQAVDGGVIDERNAKGAIIGRHRRVTFPDGAVVPVEPSVTP